MAAELSRVEVGYAEGCTCALAVGRFRLLAFLPHSSLRRGAGNGDVPPSEKPLESLFCAACFMLLLPLPWLLIAFLYPLTFLSSGLVRASPLCPECQLSGCWSFYCATLNSQDSALGGEHVARCPSTVGFPGPFLRENSLLRFLKVLYSTFYMLAVGMLLKIQFVLFPCSGTSRKCLCAFSRRCK